MNKNNASTSAYIKFVFIALVALIGVISAFTPSNALAQYYSPYTGYNSGYNTGYQSSYYSGGYSSTNYYPTGGYNYNTYNQGYYSYGTEPLSVTCNATASFVPLGGSVTWVATVAGGSGLYAFTWNGTDGLYGSQNTAFATYNTPGVKTASVYVTSYGQQRAVQCSNSVTVAFPGSHVVVNNVYPVPAPVYGVPAPQAPVASNNIQVACSVNKASVKTGVPVTWSVEAVGAGDNFTYAWTGSDGLSGNQSSIIKTYSTSGQKSAVVTVTSANGRSQSKSCENTLSVTSTYVAKAPTKPAAPATPVVVAPTVEKNNLSAAALFSLEYVPWGLVAVLVIILLFVAVLYLIFNRKKI